MTKSAPRRIGAQHSGVSTVLSTQTLAPKACARSHTRRTSVTSHVGLAGVSIQTSLVFPSVPMAVSTLLPSVRHSSSSVLGSAPSFKCSWSLPLRQSYSLNSHPMRAQCWRKYSRHAKYECLGNTHRSPCLSSAVARPHAAAIPEENSAHPTPPSSAAMTASAWTYVGLSGLAYTFLPGCAGADSTVVIRPSSSSSSAPSRRFDVGASMARFGTRAAPISGRGRYVSGSRAYVVDGYMGGMTLPVVSPWFAPRPGQMPSATPPACAMTVLTLGARVDIRAGCDAA
mmetsp:Transcript_5511/g.22654  ORF Transcript_5511/g.22654 Transcript_5511/m.22654 type:complete len:285 (-) Transcript_5511:96-950(-)